MSYIPSLKLRKIILYSSSAETVKPVFLEVEILKDLAKYNTLQHVSYSVKTRAMKIFTKTCMLHVCILTHKN